MILLKNIYCIFKKTREIKMETVKPGQERERFINLSKLSTYQFINIDKVYINKIIYCFVENFFLYLQSKFQRNWKEI